MALLHFFLALCWLQVFAICSAYLDTLNQGQSLFVERLNKSNNVLVSENGVFSAGFFSVGDNAFSFAIWINKSTCPTVVWMTNRDQPVNGKRSKFSLSKTGDLILLDAGQITVWSWTMATSYSVAVQLQLLNSGNLVLRTPDNVILWQSFGWPTDTLLPQQQLTRNISLISLKSLSNGSSGHYKLYFDDDNVRHLLFQTPEESSRYWPTAGLTNFAAGRTEYNNTRVAVLNSYGHFISTDDLNFSSIDFGANSLRRLTLDPDGNLRLYSLGESGARNVSWKAFSNPCKIHGACGPNSICTYDPAFGRSCSCLPGYKAKDSVDWSYGCETEFDLSCTRSNEFSFVKFNHIEFYGYDKGYFPNSTLEKCKKECLKLCNCKGFQYKFNKGNGYYECYPKVLLLNGYLSPNFIGDLYLKLQIKGSSLFSSKIPHKAARLNCPKDMLSQQLNRTHTRPHENKKVKVFALVCHCFGRYGDDLYLLGMLFHAEKGNWDFYSRGRKRSVRNKRIVLI
ncbi:S-locus-specific glycoprotein S13 precursor, putative [Ricinus communis]|uniref:non-specific serine/threonine protein kinase n=1 Tax=Ricinus communis TaxID=3988 RepID=B9R760_RICCO|nr:S-locus-specific glycoprotein S13 precursor, putative [Ricinus communis]